MSNELNLKSGTKTTKRVTMVRTLNDVQFLGVNGSQLSATMEGLHLEWTGNVVRVTHDNFPGEERWLFPAGISFIKWVDE